MAALEKLLLDTKRPLFLRYRAMFSLRNLGSDEAVLALAKGLRDPSALFRHEIAYVFGQLQSPLSITALAETLADESESDMVRHEAAESLGSIGTEEVMPILKRYVNDKERIVRESCIVAFDV